MRGQTRVVVVGAGIGGSSAAIGLATQGTDVTVVERGRPGRQDAGGRDRRPTHRCWADGPHLARGVRGDVRLCRRLARRPCHFATGGNSCAPCMGRRSAARFVCRSRAVSRDHRRFCRGGRGETLSRILRTRSVAMRHSKGSFIRSAEPTPLSLTLGSGLRGLGDLWRISPFTTLWGALGTYFHDPRLRQLFGRYATYCGSSPFAAPATLMLVAHVEQSGVWLVEGGMHRLATALADLAAERGARFRYGSEVAQVLVDGQGVAGVSLTAANGSRRKLSSSTPMSAQFPVGGSEQPLPASFRRARSQRGRCLPSPGRFSKRTASPSPATTCSSPTTMPPRVNAIFRGRQLPQNPTVYVCVQDRAASEGPAPRGPERLFCLVNAPPIGDSRAFSQEEIKRCEERAFGQLKRCGLSLALDRRQMVVTTPTDFARLYPATGGHWQASPQSARLLHQAASADAHSGPLSRGRQHAPRPGRADGGTVGGD